MSFIEHDCLMSLAITYVNREIKKQDETKIQWKVVRFLNLCYLFSSTMWPMLLDISKEECKRILRRMELEAYCSIVSAFRAQGDLTKDKKKILQDLQTTLR